MPLDKIYWCHECGIPILSDKCRHGHSKIKYCSTDLKPVFKIEKELYEKSLKIELPDHQYLFRNSNRIIFGGKTLFRFSTAYNSTKKGGDKYSLIGIEPNEKIIANIKKHGRLIQNNFKNGVDYWNYLVDENQAEMDKFILESNTFIQDTLANYKTDNVYISFSGGKDSVAVAHLIKKLGLDIPLFMSDTTLEYPETYKFVREFAEKYDFNLVDYTKYKSEQNFFELCKELGPPSIFYRWCCTVFKSYPVNKFYQEIEGDILTFDGIRKLESKRRSKYEQVSRIKKIPRQIASYPIFHWREFDVWFYILSQGIDYNPLYNYGHTRVGCYLCPAASPSNCTFRKIINYDLWKQFEELLYEYAERAKRRTEDGTHITWIDKNYWRLRRPKKDRITTGTVGKLKGQADPFFFESTQKICSSDNTYLYKFGKKNLIDAGNIRNEEGRFVNKKEIDKAEQIKIDKNFLEFLKPFGDVKITPILGKDIFQIIKGNPLSVMGFLEGEQLKVTFNPDTFLQSKKLFERQIRKAMNCVACGGCIGTCPSNAISIINNRYTIDKSKCDHCLICVKTQFVSNGCIALNFNLRMKVLENI